MSIDFKRIKLDLLIIGAGRSGTTSIYKYLDNHPEVCFSSVKEVHYFSINDLYKRGVKYYQSFFNHYKDEKIRASADTYLLMDYEAIERIVKYNPDIKILVMLRNPVERAYSSYNYSVNYGHHQKLSSFSSCIGFEKNIENEPDIIKRNNNGHLYGSLYYKHLQYWMNAFPKQSFLLLATSELKNNPSDFYSKITTFLDIEHFIGNFNISEKHNANAVPKSKSIEQFLLNRNNIFRNLIRNLVPSFIKRIIMKSSIIDGLHNMNRVNSSYEKLSSEEYDKVLGYFVDDCDNLKKDFGIDLL